MAPFIHLLRSTKRLTVAATMFLLPGGVLHAQTFSQLVTFGDSWSDTGNANQISNGAALPLLAAPYANGRYSNGFLWVDYLADKLTLSRATAERVNLTGTNFAHGGARLDDGNRMEGLWEIRDIGGQVSTYLERFTPSGSELYTFFGGGNDIASGDTDVSDEIGRLRGYVDSVYEAGGRNFLIANMPDFAKIADYTGNSSMTAASDAYNNLLDAQLAAMRLAYPDANFYEADFHGMIDLIYANPADYGFSAALKDTSYAGDFIWSDVFFEHRAPISQYMWIDGIHPTDKVHQLLGDAAFTAVSIPEPSSMALFTGGAMICLMFRKRRRSGCAESD